MGMVWVARLADSEQAAWIKDNPEAAYEFVNPEDEATLQAAEPFMIDLDKEWHGTHFLLTRSSEGANDPLSLILGSFEEVGPDIGYGPVQYIPSERIAAFHKALSALQDEEIVGRYDTDAMQQQNIYLADSYADEGEEGRQFLAERIQQLRDFARRGAEGSYHAFSVIT